MGRLVDADKVTEAISWLNEYDFVIWHDVMEYINKLPTVEAEPVKHGHWEDKYGDGDWHCSVCAAIVEKDEQNRHNWNRCYHCGAKMDLLEPMVYPQVEGITPTVVKMDEVQE